MSQGPFQVDSKSILIDALKQDIIKFILSTHILKNGKSLVGIYEKDDLKAQLLDFAKNPEVGLKDLGPKPKPPKFKDSDSDETRMEKEDEYQQLLDLYEMEKKALSMHVPVADMITINNYMEKFENVLAAASAIKGKKFFAFTKQIDEEVGGLAGMMGRGKRQ